VDVFGVMILIGVLKSPMDASFFAAALTWYVIEGFSPFTMKPARQIDQNMMKMKD